MLLYQVQARPQRVLSGLPGGERLPATTLAELIAFNERHSGVEMRWFGQEIFILSQGKGSLDDPAYRDALALSRDGSRTEIDRLLAENELDALVAPSGSAAWTIDLVNGDHSSGGSSGFPARAGFPNITVPMGSMHGLPVGISFIGTALAEPVLVEIASGYEHATHRRQPPPLD